MKAAAALAVMLAAPALAPGAAAQDGAAVFQSSAGLEARLGRPDGPLLPGGTLTCAGCHGPDGRGGVEGGLQPAPPIGWHALSTATPERPAYDRAALSRLLHQGVTPSGREISARMPRFSGLPETIDALTAYLQSLDMDERQGLAPASIAIALPADPALHKAAQAAIAAFNAEGGAFGRRAVIGSPAFVELDQMLAALLPRLAQAEQTRLQALLRTDPDLHAITDTPASAPAPARVAGTLDQIGPELPRLLAGGDTETIAIGPLPEAMLWAVRNRQSGSAAHAYAATRAALDLLRGYGRDPTRTRFAEDIGAIDAAELIEVYRQPPPDKARAVTAAPAIR